MPTSVGRTARMLIAGLLASAAVAPALAADVTAERLLNAAQEPQNWLMIHSTYDSHRFSGLDQINRDNVTGLHVAFTTAVGGLPGAGTNPTGGHQATPLVNDGMMYFPDGWGTVYAVDLNSPSAGGLAPTGRIAWIMDPGVDKASVGIPSNRGVMLHNNYVLSTTFGGAINWINATTGELVRTVQVDNVPGFGITTPPLVVGDRLIAGTGVGDFGIRAYMAALNAEDGSLIWKTYSIPAPGEPGAETWKGDANSWKTGGAGFWMTGSYDPEQNVTIWGTGNPVPMFDPEIRPGDNLYSNSALAFDVDTGAIKWYFQYTPGDFLDYDEIGVHQLINTEVNGEPRKVVSHFGRNGFFYTLDRTNGQFINAGQYVSKLNWTAGIDPKTGKPVEYDPSKDLQTYAIGAPSRRDQGTINACPNIQGGVNYFPTTYSDKTHLSYGAGLEAGCSDVTAKPGEALGGTYALAERMMGSVTAMNPATGERVAAQMLDYPVYSGAISTAGGLVFTATVDGTLYALDDTSLKPLWAFNFGASASASPMTYSVNGKQYVAVLAGAANIASATLGKSPEMADLQTTSMLYVFGL